MNIEESIKTWKTNLLNKGELSTEQTDELESHLRDEMDQVQNKELTEEERFIISMHRIGSPDTLHKAYNRSFFEGLFPFFMAMSLLVIFRSASMVLQSAGAKIYSMLSMDISTINYAIACIFYLITIGFVYLVYRQTMRLKQRHPDGSRAQFLLVKYMAATFLLMLFNPLLIRLSTSVTPVIMGQSNMATTLMSIVFIITLIFTLAISASRKKKQRMKVA